MRGLVWVVLGLCRCLTYIVNSPQQDSLKSRPCLRGVDAAGLRSPQRSPRFSPKSPPRAALLLYSRCFRVLQVVDQLSDRPPLLLKLLLEKGHLILKPANPLPGHGLCRVAGHGVALLLRRIVVQHHVHPVPTSARFPFCLNLPRGGPPVQGGQGYRHLQGLSIIDGNPSSPFMVSLSNRERFSAWPPAITSARRGGSMVVAAF